MSRRNTTDFQTIHSEGGLLPPDLLRRLLDPKEKIPGTQPEDYGLPKGERINEVITQSWNRLRRHWTEFRNAATQATGETSSIPHSEFRIPHSGSSPLATHDSPSSPLATRYSPLTSLTNDKWSLPLLRELGFGLLPASAGPELDGRTYAINRFFSAAAIHLVGCGVDLDRRAAGVRGAAAANPHGLVQEFLNRSQSHLWAIVSNGLRFRILRDNQALSRQSYLEFDLESMFNGEVYADFVLLWLTAHASRFMAAEDGKPESCLLEQWTKVANEQGARALESLRGGVERALQVLGQGFVGHPRNTALREALRSGQVSLSDFHGQLLRVVYRLIFLFVAEDRTLDGVPLLHPPDDSELARTARERYTAYYSTTRLRELAAKIRGSRHGDLWQQFNILSGALSGAEGFAAAGVNLAMPSLGSFLWSPESTLALNAVTLVGANGTELANADFLEALRHLAFTRQNRLLRQVDYKNLGAEELGGVYESLLALTPQISGDGSRFNFAEFSGNERKTSGSYYTPDSLVQCLLDSALDPVVEDAIKCKAGREAEKALLSLKVCDPAVGSGHFLVGAAHRLARHLSRVRALAMGDSESSPILYQQSLRDVIGHCLYGVDINPMAAELCKISLWLEALEPGKPLSFLDHHIQCGNSLIGATPELIEQGIPDEAFTPIEGDDRAYCTKYKKRNKEEGTQMELDEYAAWEHLGNLPAAMAKLDALKDDTIDGIQEKQRRYEAFVRSADYVHSRFLADAWCAAFVWPKRDNKALPYPITNKVLRQIERNPKSVHDFTPWLRDEVQRIANQYNFFHWHLAFPEVFPPQSPLSSNPQSEIHNSQSAIRNPQSEIHNSQSAIRNPQSEIHNPQSEIRNPKLHGGFDLLLGNPPWEHVELKEKEWFAERSPEIANAPNGAVRKRMISDLQTKDPNLYELFNHDLRFHDGLSHFMGNSGRYPLCGRGRINVYTIFAELNRELTGPGGRVGCILPSGIATDDTTKFFFQNLMDTASLASLYDFENRNALFPGVHRSYKFCLLTLRTPSPHALLATRHSPLAPSDFVFFALHPDDLREPDRHFALSAEDIALLNPNTRTCPIFRSKADAELTKAVYRRVPVLIKEARDGQPEENPWGITFKQGLFNMTSDSHLFRTREQLESQGYRLEGNHFVVPNPGEPRYLPLYEAKMIHHYDHRCSQVVLSATAMIRQGQPENLSLSEHQNPYSLPQPRYWVTQEDVLQSIHTDFCNRWFQGFSNVTSATNERTMVTTLLPCIGVGHSMPLILFPRNTTALEASSFLSCLISFAFDYVARQKLGGINFTFFIINQLAVHKSSKYDIPCSWHNIVPRHSPFTIRQFLLPRVLELTYTAWDLEPFARDCGWNGPPFRWDEERRFLLRCELDAAFFHLYLPAEASGEWRVASREDGCPYDETPEQLAELKKHFPTPRYAVDYIMDTFPIVKRKDEAAYGHYRTKDTILDLYDAMQRAIATGEPYQTRLDPPPADPRCCHPPKGGAK